MPSESTSPAPDRSGIPALILAFAVAGVAVVPAVVCRVLTEGRAEDDPAPEWMSSLAAAAPWSPGAPMPLLRVLSPRAGTRVVENEGGELVTEEDDEAGAALAGLEAEPGMAPSGPGEAAPGPVGAVATSGGPAGGDGASGGPNAASGAVGAPAGADASLAASAAAGFPSRAPAHATPLVDPGDRGMSPFYAAIARSTGLARAAHYGDSTIAADGITGTVRRRLQARFGNGGPGWVDAGIDPRWSARPDLGTKRQGEWDTKSILLGGANGRYGFGGVVSTAPAEGTLTINAPKGADGAPVPLTHLEVWYQRGPGNGQGWASANGSGVGAWSAAGEGVGDDRFVADLAAGYTRAAIGATGGSVPFYGVVLETAGPGVVWDALGVVGVGSRSFTYFNQKHLAAQAAQRAPDLVVLMIGGNELGFPVLSKGDGSAYEPYFREALHRVREGVPAAGCLVVTPLDQATREGDTPHTKPALKRLIAAQQRVASEEGCAFWNAFEAMGGEGAIVRWTRAKPPLAWADLLHLSTAGQDLIGQSLADAIEAGYEGWKGRKTP